MATHKPAGKKTRLARQTKTNRRVPAWVVIKTDRKFMRHPKRHHWRIGRLKV